MNLPSMSRLFLKSPTFKPKNPIPRRAASTRRQPLIPSSLKVEERGVEFETGGSFFRRDSAVGRDLGILAAALHRRSSDNGLRVLDAMCGCGVRSIRYLVQAEADFVWANDAFEGNGDLIASNLSSSVSTVSPGGEKRWVVTHYDANRLLMERYLQRDYFDFIDVDSFGSDSSFIRSAISAVKIGGLLYLTSTDGVSSGGHRPQHSLSSYGAYVRPMPFSNEVGLRMLIGGAFREAAAAGFLVSPLFSYYSCHGPVFRVMLQIFPGNLPDCSKYGFVSYCNKCGHSQTYQWAEIGHISCVCRNGMGLALFQAKDTKRWHTIGHYLEFLLGPFPSFLFGSCIRSVVDWASARLCICLQNVGFGNGKRCSDLEYSLNQMIDESDPRLPAGYIKLDEIASRGKINSPPASTILSALQKENVPVLQRQNPSVAALIFQRRSDLFQSRSAAAPGSSATALRSKMWRDTQHAGLTSNATLSRQIAP